MALSDIDRNLLQRCLARKPRAWEDFVDRFPGLIMHVVHHSAQCRSIRLSSEDAEDLAADVFLALIDNDFAVLRRFRGECSLATYLTVVARRVVVRELLKRRTTSSLSDSASKLADPGSGNGMSQHEERITNQEQVHRLLQLLDGKERDVVRMYHLEGLSYGEISKRLGVPENSIGPTLSRAREKMRKSSIDSAVS